MRYLLAFILMQQCLCSAVTGQMFAYERGKCENSIFNVFQDMLKMELRALIDPNIRNSIVKQLQFELYTPLNPYESQMLRAGDVTSLKHSNFNPKWPVRFSIHGWAGKGSSCSNAAIKDAYLARGNYNVIIVDWSRYAFDVSYSRISRQFKPIAATIVKFLRFLHDEAGVPYDRVYLIGHSAGCHISGWVGKLLKPDRLGAIIALDPAGLVQLHLSSKVRLAPDDALYVESIHTDLTLLGNPSAELSQATFYANWGQGQSHCPNATAAEFDFACDHFAAMYYFAASIRHPKMFGALRCDSQHSIATASCKCRDGQGNVCEADAFMGGEPAVRKSGVYYFNTLPQPPYGNNDGLVHWQPPMQSTVLESSSLPRKQQQQQQRQRRRLIGR